MTRRRPLAARAYSASRFGAAAALGFGAFAACSTDSQPAATAGLEVIVMTDRLNVPLDVDSLRLEIAQPFADGGFTPDLVNTTYDLAAVQTGSAADAGAIVLPATFGIEAAKSPEQVRVAITGYKSGAAVILREALVQAPTDRLASLWMVLSQECLNDVVTTARGEVVSKCGAAEDCVPTTGGCAPYVVNASTLVTYANGQEFVPPDAGVASNFVGSTEPFTSDAGDGGEGSPNAAKSGDGSLDAAKSGDGSLDAAKSGDGSLDAAKSGDGSFETKDGGDGGPDAEDGGDGSPSCTGACAAGSTRCAGSGVQKCELQASGCTQWVPTATCAAPETCATLTDAGPSPVAACSLTCSSTCTSGQAACAPAGFGAIGLETCQLGTNGCWAYAAAVACPTHQTCTGIAGSAACICKADPVCSVVGSACANPSTLASCAQDSNQCLYQASMLTCPNGGACSGGACCTNACVSGATSCAPTSSTQLQSCAVGANGCTAITSTACGAGLVCERYAPPSCVDPEWAEWPIVDSPSFTSNGDGTVTDNGTGLVWQQAVASGTFAQSAATAYCSALSLGGFSDWRLPSDIELMSIVDLTAVNPSINTVVFALPSTPNKMFWTSSPCVLSSGEAWIVDFYDGKFATPLLASTAAYARCVR